MAYAALGLANIKPLREGLVQWLKGERKYTPATLKSKLQGCPICLSNKDNQNHYLIKNVGRLLWDDEEKYDIVVDKTDMAIIYRYLALTDRLIATLAMISSQDS